MPNTSATGGYLSPAVLTPPEEGDDLDAIFQACVVGVTGLAGALVRPRWQPTVPKMPEQGTDWAAVGVRTEKADAGPYIQHNPSAGGGVGTDTMQRHELIEVSLSFYGPNGQRNAALMRDGLSIPQNLEVLNTYQLYYRDALPIVSAPEQINNLWFKRYDYTVFFARKVTRTYGIENLESANAELLSDTTPQIVRHIPVVHP